MKINSLTLPFHIQFFSRQSYIPIARPDKRIISPKDKDEIAIVNLFVPNQGMIVIHKSNWIPNPQPLMKYHLGFQAAELIMQNQKQTLDSFSEALSPALQDLIDLVLGTSDQERTFTLQELYET